MPWTSYPLYEQGDQWYGHPPAEAMQGIASLLATEKDLLDMDTYSAPNDDLTPPPPPPAMDVDPTNRAAGYDFVGVDQTGYSFDFYGITINVLAQNGSSNRRECTDHPVHLLAPQSHLIAIASGSNAAAPPPAPAPGPAQALAIQAPRRSDAFVRPTAVFHLAQVITSLQEGTYSSGSPPPAPQSLPSSTHPELSMEFIEQHKRCLSLSGYRAKMLSIAVTSNDVEAASEFITQNPPVDLQAPLDAIVDEFINAEAHGLSCTPTAVDAYVKRKVSLLVSNDAQVRTSIRREKDALGVYLEKLFSFAIDTVYGSKDSRFFCLKEENDPAEVRARANLVSTVFGYAHAGKIIPFVKPGVPITVDTHYELRDLRCTITLHQFEDLTARHHHFRAWRTLSDRNTPSRQARSPFTPDARQSRILRSVPIYRNVKGQLRLMYDNGTEGYILDFQAEPLLCLLDYAFQELHASSLASTGSSVIESFYNEQHAVSPFSSQDLVAQVIPLPVAILAAALYAIRENPALYLAGLTGEQALARTPNAVVVFQAKILAVQKTIKEWLPRRVPSYLWLRHRILALMKATFTSRFDRYVEGDLGGAAWVSTDADHLAYGESHTTRTTEAPITLTPASLLSTSVIASARTRDQTLALFGMIRK